MGHGSGDDHGGHVLRATSFNQDISGLGHGSGDGHEAMFKDATAFNQDISGWDTASGDGHGVHVQRRQGLQRGPQRLECARGL